MSKIALGQTATYVSASTGNRKAALVVATAEDTTEGRDLGLRKNTVNVVVFNPKTGETSLREGIPVGQKAFQKAVDRANEYHEDEDGYEIEVEAPRAYLEV